MRRAAAGALFLGLATLPLAPVALSAGAYEACTDGTGEPLDRIAACQSLLPDIDSAPIARQLAVLTAFGDLLVTEQRYDEALGPLDRALALDPQQPRALLRRSIALDKLDRDAEALADLTRLSALTPDDDFVFYRLGYTLNNLGRHEAALEALDRAAALDSEYYWTHFERLRTLERLQRWPEAGQAARAALALRPLQTRLHLRAFRAFDKAGARDSAAYHAQILTVLDPNRLDQLGWLDDYLSSAAPAAAPGLPEMPWRTPPEGRAITYLQVRSEVFQRDQVAEAISWFSTAITYPKPDRALVFRQSLSPAAPDSDSLIPRWETLAVQGARAPPKTRPPLWRGLIPLEKRPPRPGPPVAVPEWGATSPADAWPLGEGKAASGRARYVALCATASGLSKILSGCRPGSETVPLGDFDWSLSVTREQIRVPAGWFDTWRVTYAQTGTASLMGADLSLDLRAQSWLVPELDTWIARRVERDGRFSLTLALDVPR